MAGTPEIQLQAMQVQDRDGVLHGFAPVRVRDAILAAMAEAGVGGIDLAEELTAAVLHFLHESGVLSPLGVDQVHDMVEKVLMGTGQREIARAYVLRRERRARLREPQPPAERPAGATPLVQGRRLPGATPWDRSRIAEALIEEADLDRDTAEAVADAVEGRVLRSGLTTVNTALLRELVDSELFERGWTTRLRRQAQVALPKYDLERLLFHGGDPGRGWLPGDPLRLTDRLGRELVRQYVQDELLAPELREASARGRLHLEDLDRCLQYRRVTLDARALDPGVLETRAARPARVLRDTLRHAVRWLPFVAGELELTQLGAALLRDRPAGPPASAIDVAACGRALLAGLREWAGACTLAARAPRLVLRVPFMPRVETGLRGPELFELPADGTPAPDGLGEDAAWILMETLRHALLEQDGGETLAGVQLRLEVSPATFALRRYRESLRGVLGLLDEQALVTFRLDAAGTERQFPEDRPDWPGPSGVAAVGSRVVVSLPELARRLAGLGARPRAQELTAWAVLLRSAVRARAELLTRLRLHPQGALARTPAPLPGPLAHAVGLFGLEEACQILTGNARCGCVEARAVGEQLLAELDSALEHAHAPDDLVVWLEEALPPESLVTRGAAPPTPGIRFPAHAPLDPLRQWQLLAPARRHVRCLDRLDDTVRLRVDGVDVVMAYLEEVCSCVGMGSDPTAELRRES